MNTLPLSQQRKINQQRLLWIISLSVMMYSNIHPWTSFSYRNIVAFSSTSHKGTRVLDLSYSFVTVTALNYPRITNQRNIIRFNQKNLDFTARTQLAFSPRLTRDNFLSKKINFLQSNSIQDFKSIRPLSYSSATFCLLSSTTSSSDPSLLSPSSSGYKKPSINWYPGHIASAERQLSETLKAVDVVIEVRDARIPKATAHPKVRQWAAGKPRIVVFTRIDMVPQSNIQHWKKSFKIRNNSKEDMPLHSNRNQDEIKIQGDSIHRAMQALNERKKYSDTTRNITHADKKNISSVQTKQDEILDHVEALLYVDAKHGQGIHAIHRAVLEAGRHVNARRISKGLNPRPLRVGILGYPNVGKSALINRILGQNRAKSADTPGVTRHLRWVKVRSDGDSYRATGSSSNLAYGAAATDSSGRSIAANAAAANTWSKRRGEFELLDSPGIIPANMLDQSDAMLLAACNSIGQGAYDNQDVAAYLMEWIKQLHLTKKQSLTSPVWRVKCKDRYGFDPLVPINNRRLPARFNNYPLQVNPHDAKDLYEDLRLPTGEDMIYMVADKKCQGDPETAARMILQDFRSGRLGPMALQIAPETESTIDSEDCDTDKCQRNESEMEVVTSDRSRNVNFNHFNEQQRSKLAIETAQGRGLELPPIVMSGHSKPDADALQRAFGKGMFDGW